MVGESTVDESKMPPRCCTQPIPSAIIKAVLGRDHQQAFLKAVVEYSTPWEARIYCPNAACAVFIPPRSKNDAKHPFETSCKSCKRRVCVTCKGNAHRIGQDCPEDAELGAVLKMAEKAGWRRCYKCRTLVELSHGCTHITCRCKAQFCYICGAVWSPMVGCPNFCNGEEELERRRAEEQARLAQLEAEEKEREEAAAAEEHARQEADRRTQESEAFAALKQEQEAELARFLEFQRRMRQTMEERQASKRVALRDEHDTSVEKVQARHARTVQHLDDIQLGAEVDLRFSLAQSEKSIMIKLKHMEAFCQGRFKGDQEAPSREVTQRHLDQLEQQYRIRDGIERKHQSQINVLREKQAQKMEELIDRLARELKEELDKNAEAMEGLAVEFANEADWFAQVFQERKSKMARRWTLAIEVLRVEQETLHKARFGPMSPPRWPDELEMERDCLRKDSFLSAVLEVGAGASWIPHSDRAGQLVRPHI